MLSQHRNNPIVVDIAKPAQNLNFGRRCIAQMEMQDMGINQVMLQITTGTTNVVAGIQGDPHPLDGLAQFNGRMRILSQSPGLCHDRQTNSSLMAQGITFTEAVNFCIEWSPLWRRQNRKLSDSQEFRKADDAGKSRHIHFAFKKDRRRAQAAGFFEQPRRRFRIYCDLRWLQLIVIFVQPDLDFVESQFLNLQAGCRERQIPETSR